MYSFCALNVIESDQLVQTQQIVILPLRPISKMGSAVTSMQYRVEVRAQLEEWSLPVL